MIAKVYDNLFSPKYIIETEELLSEMPVSAINIANGRDYPKAVHGTHRLFGECIFARTNFNRVETLSKDAERFFDIFEHIQKVTDEYYYLNRIDFNLQHSFCDGSFHLDGNGDNEYTNMYMANHTWDTKEWGGQFQLCDKEYNVIEEHEFVPGRVLVFPSNIFHRGLGPRHPYVYRYTVVWRVQDIDSALDEL